MSGTIINIGSVPRFCPHCGFPTMQEEVRPPVVVTHDTGWLPATTTSATQRYWSRRYYRCIRCQNCNELWDEMRFCHE